MVIKRGSSKIYDIKKFIADSGTASHMVTTKENINKQYSKIRVTIGYSETLTRTKHGNWHGYHKCDRKLHRVMLSDIEIIPVINAKLLSMTRELPKGF